MINEPPPFKCLDIRIPFITPVKGRGFIDQGSGLPASPSQSFRNVQVRLFHRKLQQSLCILDP